MKRVYTAQHPTDAHMLRDLLEAEGIPAESRGEHFYGWRSMLMSVEPPTVWIMENSDLERALRFVEKFSRRTPEGERAATWQCDTCGEYIEEQFVACWKCSSLSEAPDDDPQPRK